jgi:hypothetical protein
MISQDDRAHIADWVRAWGYPRFHFYTVDIPLSGVYDLKEIQDNASFYFLQDLRMISAQRATSLQEGFTDMAGIQITSDLGMFSMLDFEESGDFRRNTVVDGLAHTGSIRIEWFCQEPTNNLAATLKLIRVTPY